MLPASASLSGLRAALILVLLSGGCREALIVPEAEPDVSGTYVSSSSRGGISAVSATVDSTWVTLESVGHFVYGRWREPYGDGTGYFNWVVTGHLSWDEQDDITLLLEYTSVARGRCHLWGTLDGLWQTTGEKKRWPAFVARRFCEGKGSVDEDVLFFVRLDP